jgi:hypothetical protein
MYAHTNSTLEEDRMKSASYVLLSFTFTALLIGAATDSALPAPTPEPSTIVLLGAGMAGIGFMAWRKNRKK